MKISYDKKIDAMYIYLASKKKKITRTEEVGTNWIADYSGTEIVGIEILNASKVLGSKLGLKSNKLIRPAAVAHRIR